ncbi:MAG: Lpg1974 family pore-forming outer membrane protein [Planctomycetota bacterium]|jgi:hypothetical protein
MVHGSRILRFQPPPDPPQWAHLAGFQPGEAPAPADDLLDESLESCDSGCATTAKDCCDPAWSVFGEFLYLRPRNAEVVYAVPINGAVIPPPGAPIQIGPTAIVDPDFQPGFRAGVSHRLGPCSRIEAAYTLFESSTSSSTSILPPNVMHSMVSHPGTDTASQRFLAARADYRIDFDLIDVDFRRILGCSPRHKIEGIFGVRYARLQQDMLAQFTINTSEVVTTDLGFDGGGIRLGLETEWYGPKRAWFGYGRGVASFVGGEFRGTYTQDDLLGQRVVFTDWKAGRLVSMLDLELGVGWISPKGCFRLSGGYMVSGWFNTVTTGDFVNAVQTNEFGGLGDTLTFDGLVARAEIRF